MLFLWNRCRQHHIIEEYYVDSAHIEEYDEQVSHIFRYLECEIVNLFYFIENNCQFILLKI